MFSIYNIFSIHLLANAICARLYGNVAQSFHMVQTYIYSTCTTQAVRGQVNIASFRCVRKLKTRVITIHPFFRNVAML